MLIDKVAQMKLVTCIYRDNVHLGVWETPQVLLPALSAHWNNRYSDMLALIDDGTVGSQTIKQFTVQHRADIAVGEQQVTLLAPIPRPRENVICLGWNYKDHIKETTGNEVSSPLPKAPVVFTKSAACVSAPNADIPYDPQLSSKMDWEVELAVVIGCDGYAVKQQDALDYVFGYTVINDITARDLQKRHRQFYLGKSLPAACPMGPCIVTADEIVNPQQLAIQSKVNGVIKQQATTADQIFEIATVIAILSKTPGIQAGNIIATGTPSGVGYVREPPEYLTPGDVVECEVEGIGTIRNTIVEAL